MGIFKNLFGNSKSHEIQLVDIEMKLVQDVIYDSNKNYVDIACVTTADLEYGWDPADRKKIEHTIYQLNKNLNIFRFDGNKDEQIRWQEFTHNKLPSIIENSTKKSVIIAPEGLIIGNDLFNKRFKKSVRVRIYIGQAKFPSDCYFYIEDMIRKAKYNGNYLDVRTYNIQSKIIVTSPNMTEFDPLKEFDEKTKDGKLWIKRGDALERFIMEKPQIREEIISCYNNALNTDLTTDEKYETYIKKGYTLLGMNKDEEAAICFNKAEEIDPYRWFLRGKDLSPGWRK